ncbi:hypothetical protein [Rhodococcus sp. B50]|uniref:hypothetical protein n=1 Tax=Rhodococcus sp. B50 TaxID=2682847 RepID=UPI001BD3F195|nr:putative NAD-dependent oxidoreductase [Rhodococcus sp. B50]
MGRFDIVVVDAGIVSWGRFWEMMTTRWNDVIDINLTDVFNTLRAAGSVDNRCRARRIDDRDQFGLCISLYLRKRISVPPSTVLWVL